MRTLIPLFLCSILLSCSSDKSEKTDGGSGIDSSAKKDAEVDAEVDAGIDAGADTGARDTSVPDGSEPDAAPSDAGETELVSTVSDHGITWTFDQPVRVGRFITGDYYVVGPVTIQSISPAPANGRNGSVLNIPPMQNQTGFDDRTVQNRYEASLRANLPIALAPGDSLASSISVTTPGEVDNWLREGNNERSDSPVWSVSVLTCLQSAAPADAFRPSYADTSNRIYRLGDVNRSLLPQLTPPSSVETDYINLFADRQMRPWIDNLFYAFDAQVEYMAMYGREMARVAAISSLLLMLDLPQDQKAAQDKLLIAFLQRGIDLWGLAQAGYEGWYAHGGHGSGRKLPIVFAGLLLGDAAMASPTATLPNLKFGEDMHTAFASGPPYGPAWNGATVIYTGHMGIWNGQPVSSTPGWGPYEHLSPADWEASLSEGYRRCCTSLAWVGQALAVRLLNGESDWNHDAFFAYVDRWMDPAGDAQYTQQIFDLSGFDYRASWQAHGQAWDDFVEEMWAQYR